jgi:hypothetical protein
MPRYFFDLHNDGLKKDIEGADLANDAAAQQEAKLRALNGTAHQIAKYPGENCIVVRNEAGEEICRAPIKHA